MVVTRMKIYCDGGARGNPGPAAIGFVAYDENNQSLASQNSTIGIATNNIAEYQAVVSALEWLNQSTSLKPQIVEFFIDSQLVVRQLNGLYKIKNAKLRDLNFKIRQLEQELYQRLNLKIVYHYIPRTQNTIADRLVNEALDNED